MTRTRPMLPAVAAALLATATAGLVVLGGVPPADPASAAPAIEANLKALGHTDLGGAGAWDAVAVVGTTAVASAAPAGCGPASATVVDARDAAHPHPVARIPVPDGLTVAGLAAAAVTTPAFTGDLLALAVRACRPGAGGAGVDYLDLRDPAAPRPLGRADVADPQSVSLAVRQDGRAVAATVVAGEGGSGPALALDDVSDPARPAALARWARPPGESPPCPDGSADAALAAGGQRAVVAFGDGGVYDLELDDPAHPSVGGYAPGRPGDGGLVYGTSLPVGRRSLIVVSQGPGPEGGCGATAPDRGVRLLALDPRASVGDLTTVRYPSPAAPGRLAASGELAFVAWHGDGLRILDLGQVGAPTVAQFVPPGPGPDVVGVAVLGGYLVVADRGSGLYVLQRPGEGQRESLWSKIKGAAGFMSIPVLLGGLWAIPRLAMGSAPAASRSRVPVPVARRRPR